MDPLSLTASAITILQLTTELISGTKKFYTSVKHAPKEIAELADELSIFRVILERLKSISQQAEEAGPPPESDHGAARGRQQSSCLPMLHEMIKADAPLRVCSDEMLAFKKKLNQDSSKLSSSLKWPFRKDETKTVVQRLRNLRSLLDTAIASDQLALNVEIQRSITNVKDAIRKAASQELSEKIFSWLSAPDPSSNLESARKKRQEDTGTWLLESPAFVKWKCSACSLLWLFGKAGAGKTVLTSTAIHSLFNEKGKDSVAYFYFDFQASDKQGVSSFLNSIIVQLFEFNEQAPKVIEHLYILHSHGRTAPTVESSKSALRNIVNHLPSVYVIIDALDECEHRSDMLECLEDFRSWNQQQLHIMVTSRREVDIEDRLDVIATEKLSLEESVVQEDILLYVRHQLRQDKSLSKWPEKARREIEITLLEGAQGMFRWVECQLHAIRSCMKLVHLRKTLKTLPKTLDDTYARILNLIDEDYVEDVRRILSCLVFSFYPLSLQEVADIVPIMTHGKTFYDEEYRLSEPRDILRICSGLVTTTYSTRTTHIGDRCLRIEELRLAHYSVKEYLVSGRISSQKLSKLTLEDRSAHETLADLCIRYLLWCHGEAICDDQEFLMKYATIYLDIAAFAPYAAACWSRHLRAARLDESSPLYQESMKLLTDPRILRDIIRLHPPWFRHQEVMILERFGYVKTINGNYYLDNEFENVPPLYYASLLGVDRLVHMSLDQGNSVNCSNSEATCLSAAASCGHSSTVRLLLARGALVDATVPQKTKAGEIFYSRSPVHKAVYGQHEEVLILLLAAGADVNICRLPQSQSCDEIRYNTPLQTAVGYRSKSFVRLLIGAGADPNAAGGLKGTALEIASNMSVWDEDSVDLMTMLLEAGADPNLTSDPDNLRTPLFNVIHNGNQRNFQLLIEHGVAPQSIDSRIVPLIIDDKVRYEKDFQWAIAKLVQLKPDISLDLPLVAAAKFGYIALIQFMLKHGACPNSRDNSDMPALHAAAFAPKDCTETLESLLKAGADINIHGGPFHSVLHVAALSGKAAVVEFLLERGASIDYECGSHGSAISIARAELGKRKRVPQLWKSFSDHLVHIKAHPNIRISHADDADYQAVIALLLAHGAKDT